MAVKITLQFSLKQLQLLLLFFFLFSISATSLTFNFPSFPPAVTNNLFIEGDASLDGSLRLAFDDKLSVGRATFSEPFLLRQNSTGKLADFTSTFTFVIDSKNNPNYGDGLVFFLAPAGSKLNRKLGVASCLGLPVYSNLSTQYEFVAVEFDIYPNMIESIDWGHNYTHVGIDINSVNSSTTEPWSGGIMEGKRNNATINYNSTSKNLSVAFTTFENGVQVIRNISFIVDLLQYLPETVIVGFSASTGGSFALHQIISWNFTSTPLVDDHSGNNNTGLAVGLSVGGFLTLVCVLALVWFIFCRKQKETRESSGDGTRVLKGSIPEEFEKRTGPRKFSSFDITSSDELPMIGVSADMQLERETGPRQYSYGELGLATSNYSNGGFGDIYTGFLKSSNCVVAVKKIWKDYDSGPKEYGAEIGILSSFRHPNLVQLLGWCHEGEALLVYEFMPNGSLDSHLFGGGSLLNWEIRYRIAQDLASVLKHIQQQWNEYVVHRDIKSSNIMLDSQFNPKLGDFGLARFVDSHDKSSKTTIVAGTVEYMPPQYVTEIRASKDTDIFSFGVVALEIACGRKPFVHSEKFHTVVEWIWELYKGKKIIEAADPKLGVTFNMSQMECLLIVGLWCSHPDKSKRPGIEQVIDVLNFKDPFLDPNIPAPVETSLYKTTSDECQI